MDFSQMPGLLSDPTANPAAMLPPASQGLMSLGAGLIKAGGPSEYKNNFGGVGDAIQGGLEAYNKAATTQLQAQYMRGLINKNAFETASQALTLRQQYMGMGFPEPPEVTAQLHGLVPPPPTTSATPSPAPATGAPPRPAPDLSPPPQDKPIVASTGGGSIFRYTPGDAPPQIMSGAPVPSPQANAGPPMPNVGAPMPFAQRAAGLFSPPGPSGAPAPPPPRPPQAPALNGGSLGPSTPVQTQSFTPPPPAAGLLTPQGAPPVQPAPAPSAGPFAGATDQQKHLILGGGPMASLTLKSLEPTPEMLNAKASGLNSPLDYETAKEAGKAGATADVKLSDTIYKGITGQGSIAAQQKQNIDVLRQIAASPNFTPGAGSDLALSAQRLAAQFGINPQGAAPRELFNQISARILADQFSGLKSMASETGEAGGRIFKPMLDLEEKANITSKDSLAGIQAKLNVIDKAGDLMMKWANMADDYKFAHGQLGPAFYKDLREQIAGARIDSVLPPAAPKGPAVGYVHNGFTFKGGNPNDQTNWTPPAGAQ
jgi:hypothetical protein